MNCSDPIGVFDSGLGGISVLHTLKQILPDENYIFFGDSKYNPYGIKTKEEITARCIEICDFFMIKKVKAIVIACNTATSACVNLLREKYDVPIIGMEPALKVACEKGKHQKIVVWATNFTLKEKKFVDLMSHFENDHEIEKIPCPKLVRLVEDDQLENKHLIESTLQSYIPNHSFDSIVLGCTHFVFFKSYLQNLLKDVSIIDGNEGTARHVKEILMTNDLLNKNGGTIEFHNSLDSEISLSKKLYSFLDTYERT
ncbi:glutamate racemase [Floccifex sp.]|uniref:glutamate racemase n=1 Tax=Floccifex sp. TaxID=2815810 RepID=UPI002A751E75|nr:glutamate racemase [Floccifex sp.]MDD7281545.1 glutamate racemase [Erysipelotrichaceae bacterium]MDY2957506.1 glutamate racemase [Floccifex sp.]